MVTNPILLWPRNMPCLRLRCRRRSGFSKSSHDSPPNPEAVVPDSTSLAVTDATHPFADWLSPSHKGDDDLDKQEGSSATYNSVADSNEVAKPSFDRILPISPGQSRFWF